MPTSVCTAKASYKKAPGLLELTDTHIQWTQDGKKAPVVRFTHSEASSLFCSKEGAAQCRLKIAKYGDENGYNFAFTSPQPTASAEREKFKQELTAIITKNRAALELTQQTSVPPPSIPVTAPISNAPTPRIPPSHPAVSRAQSVVSERVNERRATTPIIPGNDAANDFRLRKKVLVSDPELASLHRDLVMSGQITETEFWDGREHLLLAQAAFENQKKGKPGQLVDPRPETVEGGEIKIRITPQLVHDIFDEYPVVAKAYSDNVPNKLSEAEFWKRYFQSKLFNAHRASIRSSATQHVVKDDPIFDKYLEKDDDGLEPRRQPAGDVDLFVDLGATLEDHGETGNERDITMQPGRQRGALPLIRKFNEHSERLLNSALGEASAAKRRKIDKDTYAAIELDDLRDSESSAGITLEMQDRERYFEGRTAAGSNGVDHEHLDFKTLVHEAKQNLQNWETNLNQLKIERKPGDAALMAMTTNVATRLDVRSRKNDIPVGLFTQMTTCQTAANEFLRQFWLSMYPQPNDVQTVVVATPAQRAAKAEKMIGYLSKTKEKVDALVRTAQADGVDHNRVEVAMKPLLNAVDWALTFYHTRKGAR
ncbi:hypothetical protein HGRIS_002568 [Hohenbuehelia grisea]|uniref:BSD domain-containing protein n=1 Tax=Hohenbuehelia grisea TaxID=104357 RepID=A0ABR3JKU4_9AGAR